MASKLEANYTSSVSVIFSTICQAPATYVYSIPSDALDLALNFIFLKPC